MARRGCRGRVRGGLTRPCAPATGGRASAPSAPHFVRVRSDNVCTVAMLNKLTSRAAAVGAVAREVRKWGARRPGPLRAAAHLPGDKNGTSVGMSRDSTPAWAARRVLAAALQGAADTTGLAVRAAEEAAWGGGAGFASTPARAGHAGPAVPILIDPCAADATSPQIAAAATGGGGCPAAAPP